MLHVNGSSALRRMATTVHIFCIFKNPTVSISNFEISFFHSSVYIPLIIDRTMSDVNVEATQNKTDRRTNETQAHTHTLSLSLPHTYTEIHTRTHGLFSPLDWSEQHQNVHGFPILYYKNRLWWSGQVGGRRLQRRVGQAEISFWARSKQTTESENFNPKRNREQLLHPLSPLSSY